MNELAGWLFLLLVVVPLGMGITYLNLRSPRGRRF